MMSDALEGGFADAPMQSARGFRAIMTAMAQPGQIETVAGARPPAPMSVATGVIVLTLCDADTPVWLAPGHDTGAVRDWITFHTGAPLVAAAQARFAIGDWAELPLDDFAIGTPEYPDRSATVIVPLPDLSPKGATLTGPGIAEQASLSLPELSAFQRNAGLFPLGLDFFFTCGDRLAGLPRTTRVR